MAKSRLSDYEKHRIKIINEHMEESHGEAILIANQRAKLKDLGWACALVDQESGGANIFGCDEGPQGGKPPFCEDKVTKERVQALLHQPLNNGVGLPQLTDRSLVHKAEVLGGAEIPLHQCVVGFEYLKMLIDHYGHEGIWHYNGSPTYQAEIDKKHGLWVARLG
jgi:hypothetical protein